MARVDSEQADVLDACLAKLITDIPQLSDKNTYISILPYPPVKITDNLFVVVSPTDGTFPEELVEGGGQNQCTEVSGILVSIFTRFAAYREGREREALSENTRGILRMKRLVLKSLTAADLSFNANLVLRSLVIPKVSGPPDFADPNDKALIQVTIRFEVTWDWSLTA